MSRSDEQRLRTLIVVDVDLIPTEMRLSSVLLQNVTPGIAGPNSAVGLALHNIYGHATGGTTLPNNALSRPPTMIMESSDAINLSPAEVYRQKHEENKLVAEIKRTAKTGNEAPTKILARQLIRLRQQIAKLQSSRAQMRGIETHTQAMSAQSSVVVGMKGVSKAMEAMNKVLDEIGVDVAS